LSVDPLKNGWPQLYPSKGGIPDTSGFFFGGLNYTYDAPIISRILPEVQYLLFWLPFAGIYGLDEVEEFLVFCAQGQLMSNLSLVPTTTFALHTRKPAMGK